MEILTMANQKGGVGKTSMACHLGFYAAENGLRTLLVDFDEGDLSSVFLPEEPDLKKTLMARELFSNKGKKKGPLDVGKNISIIPSDSLLVDVDDLPLKTIINPRENLRSLADEYDLCLLDTPPNLQRRLVASLIAADYAVSPIDIGPFTIERIPKMEEAVEGIRSEANPDLKHLGYIPAKVYGKSKNEVTAIDDLREALGDKFIDAPIFVRACVPVSLANRQPVWKNAKSGGQRVAGKEYKSACKEILTQMGFDF